MTTVGKYNSNPWTDPLILVLYGMNSFLIGKPPSEIIKLPLVASQSHSYKLIHKSDNC